MGLNLLIAEPNDDVCDALVRYFSQHGFHVRTADTAADLNHALKYDPPQALLLEPELLCGFVSGSAPSVPTVVLTRQRGTLSQLPQSFRIAQRYEKPARLEQVAESLRAAVRDVGYIEPR